MESIVKRISNNNNNNTIDSCIINQGNIIFTFDKIDYLRF